MNTVMDPLSEVDRLHNPIPKDIGAGAAPAASAPRTKLPEGFDLSRFGPHTRAAYIGPTPDNPFLSLKRRLKRASFYDRRERLAKEQGDSSISPEGAAGSRSRPG